MSSLSVTPSTSIRPIHYTSRWGPGLTTWQRRSRQIPCRTEQCRTVGSASRPSTQEAQRIKPERTFMESSLPRTQRLFSGRLESNSGSTRPLVTSSLAGSAEAGGSDGSNDGSRASTSSSSSSRAPVSSAASGSGGGNKQLMLTVAAMAVATGLCAAAVGQGPTGLVDALSKSGFAASFSLIFVSEIGDKTFFIAALLAMKYSKSVVLAGAVSALGLMSAISALIGRLFREVPAQLKTSIPIGEYLACALLVWFGVSSIRSALMAPAHAPALSGGAGGASGQGDEEEGGELAEAREYVDKSSTGATTAFAAFWETFSLVFLAEWGDRSMLATIALGAAQSPVGVALGATWGHLLATGIAVLGGAFLSQHISERTVGLTGGILFLVFAAATLMGYV